jgi:hypothetical protein
MKKLGTTCAECPANCCTFGTGERVLKVYEFLEGYMTYDSINTRCENLTPKRTCKLWGTTKLPVECRVHVCHNRSFSKEEVERIKSVDSDKHCIHCGVEWTLTSYKNGVFKEMCEVCGDEYTWTVKHTGTPNPKLRKHRKKKKK